MIINESLVTATGKLLGLKYGIFSIKFLEMGVPENYVGKQVVAIITFQKSWYIFRKV